MVTGLCLQSKPCRHTRKGVDDLPFSMSFIYPVSTNTHIPLKRFLKAQWWTEVQPSESTGNKLPKLEVGPGLNSKNIQPGRVTRRICLNKTKVTTQHKPLPQVSLRKSVRDYSHMFTNWLTIFPLCQTLRDREE